MKRILLVNPPIYDFCAYDFWVRPYGLLRAGGALRGQAELSLFDFMDRFHPSALSGCSGRSDEFSRGDYPSEIIEKPPALAEVRRRFHRFGRARQEFQAFLRESRPFDYALLSVTMTYWYLGAREAIEDLRAIHPETKIILGGVYPTLCPDHAATLGADMVVEGEELAPLWSLLGLHGDLCRPPLWEAYEAMPTGVLKLTDGCPYRCTYCCVSRMHGDFRPRLPEQAIEQLERMVGRGVRDVAFYDDALLFDAGHVLRPFLAEVDRRGIRVNFHTPNALHARFLTADLAEAMVRGGFKTFYLGFESSSQTWQEGTGGKVAREELAGAVRNLLAAGADRRHITAYLIIGHPHAAGQDLEESMQFVGSLGIRQLLAEFSPIPSTPDGEAARAISDLDEPLNHNKTAYTVRALGEERTNALKQLRNKLNSQAAIVPPLP